MEKSGSGYSKPPTCRFYNQLQFLNDSVSNRSTHSNIQLIRCDSPDKPPMEITVPDTPTTIETTVPKSAVLNLTQASGQSQASDQYSNKQQVTRNLKPEFPQATVVPKRKKKLELDPVEQFLIKSIDKKDQENKLSSSKSEDEDEQFCCTIAHTLRRLRQNSLRKNQLAKIKMQQLLFDLEFSDDP